MEHKSHKWSTQRVNAGINLFYYYQKRIMRPALNRKLNKRLIQTNYQSHSQDEPIIMTNNQQAQENSVFCIILFVIVNFLNSLSGNWKDGKKKNFEKKVPSIKLKLT